MSRAALERALQNYIAETDATILDLKKQISVLRLQNKLTFHKAAATKEQCLYLLLCFRDNGEGSDTFHCCGVFTSMSIALEKQIILVDEYDRNVNNTDIQEIVMNPDFEITDSITVYHKDDYEHGEISTHIIGVEGQLIDVEFDEDVYAEKFKIDKLVWAGFEIR